MPVISYNSKYKKNAQSLRKNMTPQEKHLWYDFLRTYPVQFRRQKQFGDYIADFYCSAVKLVIELDGSQHYSEEGLQNDEIRSHYLEAQGLTVLRYTNPDIERRFQAVCLQIDAFVRQRMKAGTSSTAFGGPPSPEGKA